MALQSPNLELQTHQTPARHTDDPSGLRKADGLDTEVREMEMRRRSSGESCCDAESSATNSYKPLAQLVLSNSAISAGRTGQGNGNGNGGRNQEAQTTTAASTTLWSRSSERKESNTYRIGVAKAMLGSGGAETFEKGNVCPFRKR